MSEERWQRLVEYLRRARSKPTFDTEERDYRLAVAAELRRVLEEAAQGAAWQERMRDALRAHFAGRKYDVTRPEQWRRLEALPPAAFASFLEERRSAVERISRFVEIAGKAYPQIETPPESWINPDILRDTILSYGSLFNFAADPETVPVVRPDVYNLLQFTLGYPWTFRIPLAEQYERQLAFADDVDRRAREGDVPVRDMLDVGALIQTAGIELDHWAGSDPATNPHYLSVCAIYRNEAPYLAEWIEFHRLVGVEHFFLYDNASEDGHLEVLAPYLDEGIVTLHHWPGTDAQIPAYDDCLRWHRHDSRWIAFIDLDEFLFSPTGQPVADLLSEYEAWPAVAVCWAQFGHAGHRTRPAGLVIENYQGRVEEEHLTTNVKCVVDPTRASHFRSSHHVAYPYLTAVDENFFPIHGSKSLSRSSSRLRINHYFYKSHEEFVAKCERWVAVGKPFRRIPTDEDFEAIGRQEDAGWRDDTILQYLPRLRNALEKRHQRREGGRS